MGYNFKCQVVIDSGLEEEFSVGAGWVRTLEKKSYTVANLTQGMGRCARFEPGLYRTITTQVIDPESKLTTLGKMVNAIFGKPEGLQAIYKSTFG